ncbi:hypothetical protein ACVWZA_003507 [Sphingomonas sp. UYAg733]
MTKLNDQLGVNMIPAAMAELGIVNNNQFVLRTSLAELARDICSGRKRVVQFQDDVFASRFNAYLQNNLLHKIGEPVFVQPGFGDIGGMIVDLRGRGEDSIFYEHGGLRGVNHNASTTDLREVMRRAGWAILDGVRGKLFYEEWERQGGRWAEAE